MSNTEIYKRTLTFSLRRLVMSFISLMLFLVLCTVGYAILEKTSDKGLIGLGIGGVIAIIIIAIIAIFAPLIAPFFSVSGVNQRVR